MRASLVVVMPAYNEAAHIETSVLEWHDEVIARIPRSSLLVVDDCSRDGTGSLLEALAGRLPALRVLKTPVNAGHGRAVRFGLERCDAEYVFQTDSDRQMIPADFWGLWEKRLEADFVFGVRAHRADGPIRAVVSRLLRGLNFVIWGRWIADANCPFKLMRGAALERLLPEIPRDAFIPMVMLSLLARHHRFRVLEVPVRHLPRTAGQQSLRGVVRWSGIALRCTRELLALRVSTLRRRAAAVPEPHAPCSDT